MRRVRRAVDLAPRVVAGVAVEQRRLAGAPPLVAEGARGAPEGAAAAALGVAGEIDLTAVRDDVPVAVVEAEDALGRAVAADAEGVQARRAAGA